MALTRRTTTEILDTDCIGDSLSAINTGFLNLDNKFGPVTYNAAFTLTGLVRYIEVFDENGDSVGYTPVYSNLNT